MRLLFAVVLLVAAAPSRGDEARIARVAFEGNRELSDSELLDALDIDELATRSPIETQLDHDVVTLSNAYADRGYMQASVALDKVEDHPPFVDATYRIVEGGRFVARSFVISPSSARVPTATRERLGELKGRTVSRKELLIAIQQIDEAYRDAGYVEASVVPQSHVDASFVDFTLVVTPGPLTTVDAVRILGTHSIPVDKLRALVVQKQHALFSGTAASTSLERIKSCPGVQEAWQSTTARGAGHIELVIEIKEGPKSPPLDAKALLADGDRALAAGDRAAARAAFSRVVHLFPYTRAAAQAALHRADLDWDLHWLERAAVEYDVWWPIHRDDPDASRAKARAEAARCQLDGTCGK